MNFFVFLAHLLSTSKAYVDGLLVTMPTAFDSLPIAEKKTTQHIYEHTYDHFHSTICVFLLKKTLILNNKCQLSYLVVVYKLLEDWGGMPNLDWLF